MSKARYDVAADVAEDGIEGLGVGGGRQREAATEVAGDNWRRTGYLSTLR